MVAHLPRFNLMNYVHALFVFGKKGKNRNLTPAHEREIQKLITDKTPDQLKFRCRSCAILCESVLCLLCLVEAHPSPKLDST